jgi:hypothetical protein
VSSPVTESGRSTPDREGLGLRRTGAAGFSGDGGPATAARINGPFGLAVDRSDNVYITDYNNNRIRKVDPAGIISTFAGVGTGGFSGDGGPATGAQINVPQGLAADAGETSTSSAVAASGESIRGDHHDLCRERFGCTVLLVAMAARGGGTAHPTLRRRRRLARERLHQRVFRQPYPESRPGGNHLDGGWDGNHVLLVHRSLW